MKIYYYIVTQYIRYRRAIIATQTLMSNKWIYSHLHTKHMGTLLGQHNGEGNDIVVALTEWLLSTQRNYNI